MSDDLAAILDGTASAPSQVAAAPAAVDPTDYLVRTVYGEADPQTDSRQAVAGVVLNRAKSSGKSYDQVVQEPGQFESWGDPKKRAKMMALDPNSDTYKQISADIQPVLKGDVSVPYNHFYSPGILKSRGKSAPDWATGEGKQIGTQMFYATPDAGPDLGGILGPGTVDDKDAEAAYQKAFGGGGDSPAAAASAGPATIKMVNGKVVYGDTNQPLPEAQAKTVFTLAKAGKLDLTGQARPGAVNFPHVLHTSDVTGLAPGDFYVEPQSGQLKQVPGGPPPANAGIGGGFAAGLGDVPNSLFKLVPGGADSDIHNAMEGNRLIYDASHAGDRPAQLGRLLGQVGGSVPLMLGGEGVLGSLAAKAPEAAGPALNFLAGNAGRGGSLIERGASLAARGAQEGAGAAALTSGSSDRPLGEQLATGAEAGALFNPLLPGAGVLAGKAKNALFGDNVVSPAVANLARVATEKYGIPLRTTQIQGAADRGAAVQDSEMIGRPGTGYAANAAQQQSQFTKGIAATFGEDADKLTPEVMGRAKSRIGGVFDQVAKNTAITDTNALQSGLEGVVAEAKQVLPENEATPLQKQVDAITSSIKDGVLSGDTYQALTRKGSPLDRATESSNPNIRFYAQQLRNHLDDALEASASDEDAQALQNARWQYKNLMTVKNLAAKANVEGEISPRLLNGAVNTSFKNRAFQGAGDLGELAQIGQTFMKEPSDSKTPARLFEKMKPFMLGAGGMGEGVMLFHDPATALKLAAGAAGAGALRYGANVAQGAAARSPATVNKLIQRSLTGTPENQIGDYLARYAAPTYVPMAAIGANNLMPNRRLPAR